MQRILVLDSDTPLRDELAEAVGRLRNAEVVLVDDEDDLVRRVKFGSHVAVFADGDLLADGGVRLVEAVRAAIVRPMVVIASNEKPETLDPELVTLVIRKPYDVPTLTGILLAAIVPPPGSGAVADETLPIC